MSDEQAELLVEAVGVILSMNKKELQTKNNSSSATMARRTINNKKRKAKSPPSRSSRSTTPLTTSTRRRRVVMDITTTSDEETISEQSTSEHEASGDDHRRNSSDDIHLRPLSQPSNQKKISIPSSFDNHNDAPLFFEESLLSLPSKRRRRPSTRLIHAFTDYLPGSHDTLSNATPAATPLPPTTAETTERRPKPPKKARRTRTLTPILETDEKIDVDSVELLDEFAYEPVIEHSFIEVSSLSSSSSSPSSWTND
jgi:hypothetical protein